MKNIIRQRTSHSKNSGSNIYGHRNSEKMLQETTKIDRKNVSILSMNHNYNVE